MPITPFLKGEKFDPETTRAMGAALEMVCVALRTGDCADDVKQAIANKIIVLAKTGERSPDALCEQILKDVRTEPAYGAASYAVYSLTRRSALCPECGQLMDLVRTIPRLGAPPEIFGFYCAPCKTIQVCGDYIPRQRHPSTSQDFHDAQEGGSWPDWTGSTQRLPLDCGNANAIKSSNRLHALRG